MVAERRVAERNDRWGKEHGFIVGVGDEETDALAAEMVGGEVRRRSGGEVP